MLLASLTVMSCGNSKNTGKSSVMPGTWQAQPIVIDGDSKDWPSPYPNYDSKGRIAYATSNDKDNLYITMQTGDEMTQLKILKQGMTIGVDTEGGKSPSLLINYPLKNDMEPLDITHEESLKRGNQDLMAKQLGQKVKRSVQDANQFTLEGFSNCTGGFLVSQTTPCGVKVKMGYDEYQELIVEIVIPFKVIYHKDQLTQSDLGKPLTVCYAIKGFKKEAANKSGDASNLGAGGASMGSARGGQGGGGGRGGGKGGRGNAIDDPLAQLYENTKTWKQFGVAYQQ